VLFVCDDATVTGGEVAEDAVVRGLRSALDADPSNYDLRAHLAEVLLRRDDHDAAATEAARVLEHAPTHETALSVIDAVAQRGGLRIEPVRSDVRLDDVAGLDGVKRRIELDVLVPVRRPELADVYGTGLSGGLLLWGPPGCGKTYVARAVAGELASSVWPVRLNEVLASGPGAAAARLHQVFESARSTGPGVVLIDELDAVGFRRRGSARERGKDRTVVTQLLQELDGIETGRGIFTLATTNNPWDIDDALLRPGRIDRAIFVPPPDEPARAAVFDHHLRSRRVSANLDLRLLAATTRGLTGADIALVCRDAARAAGARAASGEVPDWITQADLAEAAAGVVTSVGSWFSRADRHARFGDHRAFYVQMFEWLGDPR
jgi:SpoVK/Ycf46/Vps4 family AAA+-type ATPase